MCAAFSYKSNIGDFSGSRRPLKNSGSYSTGRVQTTPIFALNFGTRQRHPILAKQSLFLKVLGGVGAFSKAPTKNRVPRAPPPYVAMPANWFW